MKSQIVEPAMAQHANTHALLDTTLVCGVSYELIGHTLYFLVQELEQTPLL